MAVDIPTGDVEEVEDEVSRTDSGHKKCAGEEDNEDEVMEDMEATAAI